jgi:uncharacterized repeat protein (TIGR04076 family)
MKPGDYFLVSDGDIQIPEGGTICLWALQSLMPLITPKEREIAEKENEDWMWRVHHAQCPDPEGRVVFKIERMRKLARPSQAGTGTSAGLRQDQEKIEDLSKPGLKNLRIVVESIDGHCTSRMRPGDHFTLCAGRLYIPSGRHFCLYALQAALPLLPAKQRVPPDGDWLKEACRVLCPDPAGNVILRIDTME